ncbi:RNA polymerase sigma factor [Blastococcus sp. VKM Ac-2987]|uniref:RNA polymerase sigma factor n=1 Tax=Blastococcus sp. VKM Ac-2987 TaxID=3004141 RepID=UPI0022AB50B1|nr:sigma-70 family RNA polymerase sigma factor [Blastococcus sp. VKM Ac-2987]MCZ2860659.1 sigma-70 family RNA polymerase sigma factor [Blastococcus sp. VKM Ac-2987]
MHGDDDGPVGELVAGAAAGDVECWNRLVQRYTPLLLSVVRRFRLDGSDADDVVQTVWLRLVEQLGRIREAQALPGWIATTARHECLHVLDGRRRVAPTDLADQAWPDGGGDPPVDTDLLAAERHEALLAAMAALPERQRALLLLLLHDPPLPYEEISRRLGIPVGSIGPTRARALDRVRSDPTVQALLRA